MRRFATRRAAIAGVLVVGTFAAAVAYAAIPDSSGAIHACYASSGGQLRVVDAPADCRHSETSVALGGPTRGYEFSDPDLLAIGETRTVLGSLTLPPGKYLVHAKLDLLGMSTSEETFVVCNLTPAGGGTLFDSTWNTLEPGGGSRFPSESVALQTSFVSSGDTVELSCLRPEAGPDARARYRKLDAVGLDGLTVQTGPPPLP